MEDIEGISLSNSIPGDLNVASLTTTGDAPDVPIITTTGEDGDLCPNSSPGDQYDTNADTTPSSCTDDSTTISSASTSPTTTTINNTTTTTNHESSDPVVDGDETAPLTPHYKPASGNGQLPGDPKKPGRGRGKDTGEDERGMDEAGQQEEHQRDQGDATATTVEPSTAAPPDGGWGWMVVFSSFLIHVIADGIVYSSGVFLMEFVEVFNAGRGAASWVGALQPAVTFTVGPLASALTNRYGCRAVTILGALIAAVGFILSTFAPNLYYLYFTGGIMAGLGFGLIYLPAIVSVAQYFERRRSFATGLAVCGSGFGTFLLAPISEKLVHEYSWRGAILILGGVILNIVFCGMLFRPLEAPPARKSEEDLTSGADDPSRCSTDETRALLRAPDGSGKGVKAEVLTILTNCKPDGAGEDSEVTFLVKRHHHNNHHPSGGGGGFETTSTRGDGMEGGEGEGNTSLEIIPLSNRGGCEGGGGVRASNNFNKNHQLKTGPEEVEVDEDEERNLTSDTDGLISSIVTQNGIIPDPDHMTPACSPPSGALMRNSPGPNNFPSEMDNTSSVRMISASQHLALPSDMNDPASFARSDGALHRFKTATNGGAAVMSNNGHGHGGSKAASPNVVRRRGVMRQGSHSSDNSNTLSPLSRKDIFYSGSLLNIPMYRSQPDVYLATVTPVSSHHQHHPHGSSKLIRSTSKDDDSDDSSDNENNSKCFELSREFRSTMQEMMSFSLLKNPVFLMFGISNFFTSIGFNMPFIFLPDRAKLSGIDEEKAALLLSVIGIANTLGRIIFGFLSDKNGVNRLFLYNTALFICGAATALSPAAGDDYAVYVAYAAVFGLFIGVYVSLTSVVLVDLLGLEYLTNSFGLLLLFQGAATFVGPPLAGLLYDLTGSYDISFIVMGTLIALSGAMLYTLPFVQRRYNRKVPMVDIIRDVEMGRQAHGDAEIAEILHSREIPTAHQAV